MTQYSKRKRPKSVRQRDSAYARAYRLKSKYGLTQAAYDEMYKAQKGCCALCGEPSLKLCVDHDHKTGKIRALLHATCNAALGLFKDSPELCRKASIYLEKHK